MEKRIFALFSMAFSIVFFLGAFADAKSRIAFLESYNSLGQRIQYEPGGRFTHTALQFDDIGDQWLNAYPGEGVAIISQRALEKHGTIVAIIELPQDVSLSQVQIYLGKPFDFKYSWSDDAFYCTELIAKILQVPTHPMSFDKKFWPSNYWNLDGSLGLSPDKLWSWAGEQSSLRP